MSTAIPLTPTARPGPRRRGRAARLAAAVVMPLLLLGVVLLLVQPGLFAHTDPLYNGPDALVGPSAQHWFGTDQLGRDVYSRVVFGSQSVLAASLGGVLLASVAGVAIASSGARPPARSASSSCAWSTSCWPYRSCWSPSS